MRVFIIDSVSFHSRAVSSVRSEKNSTSSIWGRNLHGSEYFHNTSDCCTAGFFEIMDYSEDYGQRQMPATAPGIRPRVDPDAEGEVDPSL